MLPFVNVPFGTADSAWMQGTHTQPIQVEVFPARAPLIKHLNIKCKYETCHRFFRRSLDKVHLRVNVIRGIMQIGGVISLGPLAGRKTTSAVYIINHE